MLSGQPGGHYVAEQSAADALHFVGGDGHADAGGAQDDALLTLAAGHSLGSNGGKVGIVAAVGGVGAAVLHIVALLGQVGHHFVFQRQGAVITAN